MTLNRYCYGAGPEGISTVALRDFGDGAFCVVLALKSVLNKCFATVRYVMRGLLSNS